MWVRRGSNIKKAGSIQAIKTAIQKGQLKSGDEFSSDRKQWTPLAQHPEFQSLFSNNRPALEVVIDPDPTPPRSSRPKPSESPEPVEFTSRFRRGFAFFIDLGLLWIVMEGLKLAFPPLRELSASHSWFLLAGMGTVYFSILDSGLGGGASLGKKIMSIYVVQNTGGRLSLPRAFLKSALFFLAMVMVHIYSQAKELLVDQGVWGYIAFFLAWLIFAAFFIGNMIFVVFHPQRRSIFDVLLSCSVISDGTRNDEPRNFTLSSSILGPVLAFWIVVAWTGFKLVTEGHLQEAMATDRGSAENIQKEYNRHAERMQRMDEPGWTDLHRAAVKGDLEEVKRLVEAGADVNTLSEDGDAVLKEAARRGRIEVMRYLIDKGADVNIRDSVEFTPVHTAADYHQEEALKLLLDRGGNINAQNFIGFTPLRQAAQQSWHGDAVIPELLLKYGADMTIRSRDGCVPIYCATKSNNYPFVESLLKHGADPNSANLNGFPILAAAVYDERQELVELILKHGADVNFPIQENGTSPLLAAVNINDVQMVQLLLKYKPDVNQADNSGDTPLHIAVRYDMKPIVPLILSHGGNPLKVNQKGETPFSLATKFRRQEFIDLFSKKK